MGLAVIAIATLAVLAACSDDDDDGGSEDGTGTVTPAPSGFTFDPDGTNRPADSSFVFTIEEVGLGPDGWVKLRNFSSVAATMDGLYLCQPPDCFALPDTEIAAGEAAVVAASGDTDQTDIVATWDDVTLNPPDGELGVYASEDTSDPAQVRAYMQWGSDPHDGTEAAVEAGFWVSGYAPTGDDATRLYQNDSGLWLWE